MQGTARIIFFSGTTTRPVTLTTRRGGRTEVASQITLGGIGGSAHVNLLVRIYRSTPFHRSTIMRFIGKRFLHAIPVLIGVTFLVFLLLNILPGGTVLTILGPNATPKLEHALTIRLGLNHPFLQRYFHWLWSALHGDFGNSLLNNVPVIDTFLERLPVSAEIGIAAFIEALVLAIPTAILIANKPRGVLDRANIFVSVLGFSCPQFVIGLVAIIIFAVYLHWLPAIGFTPITQGLWPNIRSIILPSMTIAFGIFCGYTRILRGDLIDQLNSADYIVTAQAKGVPHLLIILRHAFRNAAFNLVTVAVLNIGTIIGGSVVVEQIFNIPGMGLLLLSAINNRDVTTVQAEVVLIACAVVVANLAADLIYAILDPRIRYGRTSS